MNEFYEHIMPVVDVHIWLKQGLACPNELQTLAHCLHINPPH